MYMGERRLAVVSLPVGLYLQAPPEPPLWQATRQARVGNRLAAPLRPESERSMSLSTDQITDLRWPATVLDAVRRVIGTRFRLSVDSGGRVL